MIHWVFLDVGNVVMNDDPVMAYLYETLHVEMERAGLGVPFDVLLSEREALIADRRGGHWSVLVEKYLGPEVLARLMEETAAHLRSRYMEYHNVIPGMLVATRELSRDHSLGLIANQMRSAVDALESEGFEGLFRFYALSEIVGAAKPDPAIFRWALQEADCDPSEAVMVGDRIDNDIEPARELGMRTVWFHAPLREKGYDPPDGYGRVYFESQLRRSVSEIPPLSSARPDGEARSSAELVAEIRRLAAGHRRAGSR